MSLTRQEKIKLVKESLADHTALHEQVQRDQVRLKAQKESNAITESKFLKEWEMLERLSIEKYDLASKDRDLLDRLNGDSDLTPSQEQHLSYLEAQTKK